MLEGPSHRSVLNHGSGLDESTEPFQQRPDLHPSLCSRRALGSVEQLGWLQQDV